VISLVTPIIKGWIQDGLRDPVGFWERAADELPWFRRWDRAFEWNYPTFRWFIGAETNLAYNALDRHVAAGRGGHAALIYLNERGERDVFTYARLLYAGASRWEFGVTGIFTSPTAIRPLRKYGRRAAAPGESLAP
jgi:acetyl-CoA synthetase